MATPALKDKDPTGLLLLLDVGVKSIRLKIHTSIKRPWPSRSDAVSVVEVFAPASTWIPNEITMENLNWNSHGCRSKWFDYAHHDAPATAPSFQILSLLKGS